MTAQKIAVQLSCRHMLIGMHVFAKCIRKTEDYLPRVMPAWILLAASISPLLILTIISNPLCWRMQSLLQIRLTQNSLFSTIDWLLMVRNRELIWISRMKRWICAAWVSPITSISTGFRTNTVRRRGAGCIAAALLKRLACAMHPTKKYLRRIRCFLPCICCILRRLQRLQSHMSIMCSEAIRSWVLPSRVLRGG